MKVKKRPVVFAMDGATQVAAGVEQWIRDKWIADFRLAEMEEWRRHDREGYVLSKENVRGSKVYVIQSFATDAVMGAIEPECAKTFRVKVKNNSNPLHNYFKGTRATARWDEDKRYIQVDFGGSCIDLSPENFAKHLHVLGETTDEKTWGAIMFMDSLRDASCGKGTLIGTYMPYQRQDEKDQPRAGLFLATFLKQIKAAGYTRLVGIDVHNKGAVQIGASVSKDVRFDHLETRCLLATEAARLVPKGARVVVVAPDLGASKRNAPAFRDTLQHILGYPIGFAIGDKHRQGDTEVEVTTIIEDRDYPIGPRNGRGDDDAAYVISPDDILATGSTFGEIEKAVTDRGGRFLAACYVHGLFTGNAAKNLEKIPHLIGTLTADPWRIRGTPVYDRITFVDIAPMIGETIRQTHLNGSINHLLQSMEPAIRKSA